MVGNNVSHANNRSKRRFQVNLQKKKFYNPETDEWISLKVSTSGIRHINKVGIATAMKRAITNGFIK